MPQSTYATNPYNISPAPGGGQGPYGAVPGPLGVPPSEWEQVAAVYPGLAEQAGTASQNINSELMGELSPETIAQLQQHAAQFGLKSGMPGSQFQGQQGLFRFGQDVEAQKRQGLQDLLAASKGFGSMLTPQALLAEIASRNATMNAAPNPTAAAQQQMADWQQRFNAAQGAAGNRGPGGGTGAYAGGTRNTQPAFNPLTGPSGGGTYPPVTGTGGGDIPGYYSPDDPAYWAQFGGGQSTDIPGYYSVEDPSYWAQFDTGASPIDSGYYSIDDPAYWDQFNTGGTQNASSGANDYSYFYDPFVSGDTGSTGYPDTGSMGDFTDPFGIYGNG